MADIREPKKVTSIEKKKKIIRSGLELFGEKGYYNTTTVEIAKRAGVSTGIVYSYFKDKKDILLQALRLYFQSVFDPIERALKQIQPPLDAANAIRALIHITIESHQNNFTAHEEMIAMSHLDEDVHAFFIEIDNEITRTVVNHLKQNGINPPHLNEKAHIAYNSVESLCHEYVYHRHDYIDYDELIEETVKLLTYLFEL